MVNFSSVFNRKTDHKKVKNNEQFMFPFHNSAMTINIFYLQYILVFMNLDQLTNFRLLSRYSEDQIPFLPFLISQFPVMKIPGSFSFFLHVVSSFFFVISHEYNFWSQLCVIFIPTVNSKSSVNIAFITLDLQFSVYQLQRYITHTFAFISPTTMQQEIGSP